MNLYWWSSRDNIKNLGDEITHLIFNKLYGVDVTRVNLPKSDVLGAGSILGWVYDNNQFKDREANLYVLGSGFMHPSVNVTSLDFLKFKLVRGYLTLNILDNFLDDEIPVGDPGILFSELTNFSSTKKIYKYGIIPHMSSFNNEKIFNDIYKFDNCIVIDFRTDDYVAVSNLMNQCEVILSQSLHGLIFADSMLIPNVWLDIGKMHPGNQFKFYDYFSTVGRPFYKKINQTNFNPNSVDVNLFQAEMSCIENLKLNVRNAFVDTLSCINRFYN